MLFSSGLFLFIFLPVFFAIYVGVGNRLRNSVLIVASLLFYSWTEPVFIFWALVSAIVDYFLGRLIASSPSRTSRKISVATGVVINLGLLIWFKYATFGAGILNKILYLVGADPIQLPAIILPIAISFIVFEKITYLVDIYRGTGRPVPNFPTYLIYVFYFPKLLAGPIIRYCDIEKQFDSRTLSLDSFRDGIVRFIYGLAKKVLIADHVGYFADQIFEAKSTALGCGYTWLGVICFTVQIYFDFSGYSDMAIGLSRTMGFQLRENFRMPYLATNFTDFWRRWHISLSTWIREYLYIPLGGNRSGKTRSYVNLSICFLLSGVWHGAAWPFVYWGLYHGLMLIADRAFWLDAQKRLPPWSNRAVTFFLVTISWVIFRSRDFTQMKEIFGKLFSPWASGTPSKIWFSPDIAAALILGFVLIFLPALPGWDGIAARYRDWRWRGVFELTASVPLLAISIVKISASTFNVFLYFRF